MYICVYMGVDVFIYEWFGFVGRGEFLVGGDELSRSCMVIWCCEGRGY